VAGSLAWLFVNPESRLAKPQLGASEI